jgi:hypothetical protein
MCKEEKENSYIDFYCLARMLSISVNELYSEYKILFPKIEIYDFTVGLNKKEMEALKKKIIKKYSD